MVIYVVFVIVICILIYLYIGFYKLGVFVVFCFLLMKIEKKSLSLMLFCGECFKIFVI